MSPWSWPRLLGVALLLALLLTLSPPAGGVPIPAAPSVPAVADATLRSPPVAEGGWSPPAGGPLLRIFDPPDRPWSPGHRGADWGTPDGLVRAPGAGTVHFSGPVAGRPVLTLSHGGGLFSSLEPVTMAAGLGVGDHVEAGQVLGTASEGHCPQRCVHWGLRRRDGWVVEGTAWDRYLDPLVALGWSGPSVLWPLEGGPGRG